MMFGICKMHGRYSVSYFTFTEAGLQSVANAGEARNRTAGTMNREGMKSMVLVCSVSG